MINILPKDSLGKSYTRPAFWLDSKEYSKVVSEINQVYEVVYKGKAFATHASFGIDGIAYIYWFENHGFNEYNIYQRVRNNY